MQMVCGNCSTIQRVIGLNKCEACKSKALVPIDSPKGQELAKGQTIPKSYYWTRRRILIGFIMSLIVVCYLVGKKPQYVEQGPAVAEYSTSLDDSYTTNWSYDSSVDSMTGKRSYFAEIRSVNTLNLGFPYSGRQRATLNLRTHPQYGKNVFITIERGQFLCPFNGCSVLVRFDDNKALTFAASEPADNSTTMLFIRNYSLFVGNLMKSSTVKIQVQLYQEGSPVLEFQTQGFDADRYLDKVGNK